MPSGLPPDNAFSPQGPLCALPLAGALRAIGVKIHRLDPRIALRQAAWARAYGTYLGTRRAAAIDLMNVLSGLADISLWQLALVAGVALFASIVGGVSGYGTGALMALVLVPIIAISALFNNTSRLTAFRSYADFRRAGIVLAFAVATCVLGAWGYTRLSSAGAALVIGAMLILSVPLRRHLKRRDFRVGDKGLALGSLGYGVVVGGTAGSGVILLSLLMATGVQGAGVIATDAAVSIVIGVVKTSVFGLAGVLTAQVVAFALLIGIVARPGAFLARRFVERLPVHVHTAILDAVVLLGGVVMMAAALR